VSRESVKEGIKMPKKVATPLADLVFTKDDFDRCKWQEAILSCKRNDCLEYSTSFFKKARDAEKSGETACQSVFNILSAITYPLLRGNLIDTPFTPLSTIELLSDKQLEVLKQLVPGVSDAEMRSRIADILWVRNRDYGMGECAVKCYLESSRMLERAGEGGFIEDRIERALRIAMQLRNPTLLARVTNHIESLLARCDDDRCTIPTLLLMKTVRENRKKLQPHQKIDSTGYAELAEKAAERQERDRRWLPAQQYWSLVAAWHTTAGNADEARQARIREAETYVEASEDAIHERAKPSYLVAHHFLTQAVLAYKEIPGTEERVRELHERLLEYGKKAREEMHVTSIEQELDQETIRRARDRVRGKTVQEALFALAFLTRCPSVSYLRSLAQDAIDSHPEWFLFQRKTFNDLGKVVAYSPSGVFGETEREATITAEMFRYAKFVQQVISASVIEPARSQINLEHRVRIDDMYPLLINNPFIPPGRKAIFARGLYYGLTGDFLLATHVLVPQLENSIRSLMDHLGEIASNVDVRGVQQELDLNKLLYRQYASLLEGIFGEDLIFDLRGFLVEDDGSNLRNLLAHGLIDSNSFSAWHHKYLWWVTLHLCCWPLANELLKSTERDADS
jgi:hypothetical protein